MKNLGIDECCERFYIHSDIVDVGCVGFSFEQNLTFQMNERKRQRVSRKGRRMDGQTDRQRVSEQASETRK